MQNAVNRVPVVLIQLVCAGAFVCAVHMGRVCCHRALVRNLKCVCDSYLTSLIVTSRVSAGHGLKELTETGWMKKGSVTRTPP